MSIIEAATIIMATVACIGLLITWLANGRQKGLESSQKVQDFGEMVGKVDTLQGTINEVKEEITSPETGLPAIKKEVSAMQINCAGTTAGFAARIKSLEGKKR